ncbi:MAG TPA: lipid A-modifier LpxR family protein [Thermohalobaculum sp.]|nr:lipid A-modifier LpxR family protein [Thermohalobaculum sp.]
MKTIHVVAAAALLATCATAVEAGEQLEGWRWLKLTNEIETQGVFWNDRYGDGKDRWKTGGITQSYVFPERIFTETGWLADRAMALEVNLRAQVMTPDDTSNTGIDPDDRPYAQYAAAGLYVRSIARPRPLEAPFAPGLGLQVEDRVGVEIGWQGDPLPFFELRDALHGMTGTGGSMGNGADVIGGEILANLEGRRSWRLHLPGAARDIELVPFVQGSLGMREVSARAGADLFIGSALAGRSWGSDLATGAVMAGDAPRRDGFHWTVFLGADVGYVAWDAFLDGGFAADGRSVDREEIVGRARAGVFLEHGRVGVGFSLNWLSKEFETQPEGQLIGAFQLKYRL